MLIVMYFLIIVPGPKIQPEHAKCRRRSQPGNQRWHEEGNVA